MNIGFILLDYNKSNKKMKMFLNTDTHQKALLQFNNGLIL